MNRILDDYALVQKMLPAMHGVFTVNDLRNLFNEGSPVIFHRRVRALEDKGILKRFKRGLYVSEPFKGEVLATKIYSDTYISLGSVLATCGLIGSIPAHTVHAVRPGRNRQFRGAGITIVFHAIAPHLMFGFEIRDGVRYATAEKAFLDVLYFYQKGETFSFNVFTDVAIEQLDIGEINTFLECYKNPRFISFVKGVLSANR